MKNWFWMAPNAQRRVVFFFRRALIILEVRLFNSMSTGRQNKAQHDASRISIMKCIVANNNSDNHKQTNKKNTRNDEERAHQRAHTVGVVIYLFDYYIVYFHVLDRKFSIYTIRSGTTITPSHQHETHCQNYKRTVHLKCISSCFFVVLKRETTMCPRRKWKCIVENIDGYTLLSHRDIFLSLWTGQWKKIEERKKRNENALTREYYLKTPSEAIRSGEKSPHIDEK